MPPKAPRQGKSVRSGSKASSPAPSPSRSDRKRAAIIAAAKEVFFEEGYAGATMDQITARAGGSKATPYALFGSKEALLLAVVNNVLEPIRTAMDDIPRKGELDSWLMQVGCMASRQIMSPDTIALQRLAIAEATRFPEIARALDQAGAEAAFKRVAPMLEEAMADGQLKRGKPEVAISHFFEMCFGKSLRDVLMHLAKVPSKEQVERDVRLAVDVFMDGWRAPTRSRSTPAERRTARSSRG